MGMKNLAKASVGTGAGTLLYTVPREFRADINDITMSNTTVGALSLKVHLVPTGGSVADSNMLIPNISIPGNTVVQWSGYQSIGSQGFIQGIASAAGISVSINGEEIR
jgi:hypothetical protein